MKLIAVSKQLH